MTPSEALAVAPTHRDVMVALAQKEDWHRGAELGVGSGLLFERLLSECPGLYLIGVDLFRRTERLQRALSVRRRFVGRCELHVCPTRDAALRIQPSSLDFVFIDAAHSYQAVRGDISAWWPAVRHGGWFGGHDYHKRFPGVIRAVDEAFGSRVQLEAHAIWWVRR